MEPKKNNPVKYLLWVMPVLLVVWGIYLFVNRMQGEPSMVAFRVLPPHSVTMSDSTRVYIGEIRYHGIEPFEVSLVWQRVHIADLENEPVDVPEDESLVKVSRSGDVKIETRLSRYAFEKTDQGINLADHRSGDDRDLFDRGKPGSVIEKAKPGDVVFKRYENSEMSLQKFPSRFSLLDGLWTVRFYYVITGDGGIYITEKKPPVREIDEDFIEKHCHYFGSPEPKNTVNAREKYMQQGNMSNHNVGVSAFNSHNFPSPDETLEHSLTVWLNTPEK